MAIYLGDDGTLDTLVRCSGCGREWRFNYDGDNEEGDGGGEVYPYFEFVLDCLAEVREEHPFTNLRNHREEH